MKKLSLIIACLFIGCAILPYAVDFKPYEGLSAYVYISADDTIKINETKTECKCNGTKKSGDGLGPCQCGSNCQCKAVNNARINKHLYFFVAKWCRACKPVRKQVELMKKSGWTIVEQQNEKDTRDGHIIIVDVDKVKIDDIESIPFFVFEKDGKIIESYIPSQDITDVEIANKYNSL